jgi:hypothetical protein
VQDRGRPRLTDADDRFAVREGRHPSTLDRPADPGRPPVDPSRIPDGFRPVPTRSDPSAARRRSEAKVSATTQGRGRGVGVEGLGRDPPDGSNHPVKKTPKNPADVIRHPGYGATATGGPHTFAARAGPTPALSLFRPARLRRSRS